ncbi:hypothetical protein LCGC14_3130020, partial [marine sediment metagenome]
MAKRPAKKKAAVPAKTRLPAVPTHMQ